VYRYIIIIAIVLAVAGSFIIFPVKAQDAECDTASVIEAAATLTESGDTDADLDALLSLSEQIEALNIACRGFSFEGNAGKLLGPIDLPEGYYRLRAEGEGFIIVELEALSGDCEMDMINVMNMELTTEFETEDMIESEGCRATIQVSNVFAPWTLVIEPIQ
jgi:hypothetical protein